MIFENYEIRRRFTTAFPMFYLNHNLEVIVHPRRNSYFRIEDVKNEMDLKAKILEWLSREACKGGTKKTQTYHLDGINYFLGTAFSQEDMEEIYTYIGNCVNHAKTLQFIESGYDMSIIKED